MRLCIWEINEIKSTKKSSKFKMYKSLTTSVVIYECEAWTLTRRDKQYLRIFECRVQRNIFGPVQNEDGS